MPLGKWVEAQMLAKKEDMRMFRVTCWLLLFLGFICYECRGGCEEKIGQILTLKVGELCHSANSFFVCLFVFYFSCPYHMKMKTHRKAVYTGLNPWWSRSFPKRYLTKTKTVHKTCYLKHLLFETLLCTFCRSWFNKQKHTNWSKNKSTCQQVRNQLLAWNQFIFIFKIVVWLSNDQVDIRT